MKKNLYFILSIILSGNVSGQYQRFVLEKTNLYDIKQQFDSQILPDTTEGSEYVEYIKFSNYWEQRLFPHGDFTRYFDAQKTFYSSVTPFANSDPWWEIGPTEKPLLGVGIGPIEFITFYNNDANKMLCGSTVGGLFYSTDGGNNWQHTGTDTWSTTSGVISAVFDPNNFQTWYAASSGQGRSEGQFIGFTGGIFRTTNEGQSWTKIAGHSQLGSEWTRINKLLIYDPNPATPNDMLIYAATSYGLSKSTNADAANPSWVKLNIPLPPSVVSHPIFGTSFYTYNLFPVIYDIEFQPQNPQTIYATVKFTGNDGAPFPNTKTVGFWRLMQSNDAGATWFEIPNQPSVSFYQPHTNYFENAEHLTIEVTNASSAADFLYIALDRGDNISQGQLWKLTVSSNNWAQIADNISIYMGAGNGFGISQFDPDEIYIAHGINFKKINFTGLLNSGQQIISNGSSTYHMDVEDLVGNPVNPNVMWMTHHGGVSKFIMNTNTWQDMSNGIGNAWVLRMAATIFGDPSYMAMGLDHDWSMISSSPYTTNWHPSWENDYYTGDGQRPLIDDKDPHNMYVSSHIGTWSFSNDFGFTFSSIPEASPFWIGEGVLNKQMPSTIYRIVDLDPTPEGNYHIIKRSFDRGLIINFQNTNITIADLTQPPFNYSVSDYIIVKLYTPAENGENYLLAHVITNLSTPSLYRHHLWRTKNVNEIDPASIVWEELPIPRNMWISDVDFDFENPDITYITYGSSTSMGPNLFGTEMVYKMDYSNTSVVSGYTNCFPCTTVCSTGCVDLTASLPNTGVANDGLTVEKGSDGGLYLGTDFGVYYTNNKFLANGTGWQKFGTDLPNVQCYGLEINYVINKIRIGLYGRGIWEHDLFCPPDFNLTLSGNIPGDFYEAENDVLITTPPTQPTTNIGNLTVRAGNEIIVQIGLNKPGEEIILGPNSHLFIHACNHPGNSFRQQNQSGDATSYFADFTSETKGEEKKIYEGKNVKYTFYPNPFINHLHIDFFLEKPSLIQVSVYNGMGQLIEILAKGNYQAGEHTVLFNNPSVKPGMYFVKISTGEKSFVRAVIKTAAQ